MISTSTDGSFTLHRVEIPATVNKPIYLIPFGDIHRFAHLCDVQKWLDFCAEQKDKKDTLYIGMGDYDDFLSMYERKMLQSCAFHESTVEAFDEIYLERTQKLAKELEFLRGRCIGLLEGNHYGVFTNGMTTTQKLCELIGCKYLGCSSFIRLVFQRVGGHSSTALDIWAHHGTGASRTLGSSIMSLSRLDSYAQQIGQSCCPLCVYIVRVCRQQE